MNRILFEEKLDRYELSQKDERFEHVRGVLRMGVGDCFDVGVVNGDLGKARIVDLLEKTLICEVEWTGEPSPLVPVHLLVGMPRPQTAKKILFEGAVFGVERISFVMTKKSDPGYRRSRFWLEGEWRKTLIQGAEQAFHSYLPQVEHYDQVEAFLENYGETNGLVLDVYEGSCGIGESDKVALPMVVGMGPEGGWSAGERRAFRESRYELVGMGNRVMRCETATVAALSVIYHRLGLWN